MKKLIAVGVVGVLSLIAAGCALGSSGESAKHRQFPIHAGKVKALEHGAALLGSGRIEPFKGFVYAQHPHPGGKFCVTVSVVGPLHKFPNGQEGAGGELSERKCGLEPSSHARVVAVPVPSGESWASFDVGIGVYRDGIRQLRVKRSDESRAYFPAQRAQSDLGVAGLSAVTYGVFAVDGCVTEAVGVGQTRVVAPVYKSNCDAP
jgi:hypothetical protein